MAILGRHKREFDFANFDTVISRVSAFRPPGRGQRPKYTPFPLKYDPKIIFTKLPNNMNFLEAQGHVPFLYISPYAHPNKPRLVSRIDSSSSWTALNIEPIKNMSPKAAKGLIKKSAYLAGKYVLEYQGEFYIITKPNSGLITHKKIEKSPFRTWRAVPLKTSLSQKYAHKKIALNKAGEVYDSLPFGRVKFPYYVFSSSAGTGTFDVYNGPGPKGGYLAQSAPITEKPNIGEVTKLYHKLKSDQKTKPGLYYFKVLSNDGTYQLYCITIRRNRTKSTYGQILPHVQTVIQKPGIHRAGKTPIVLRPGYTTHVNVNPFDPGLSQTILLFSGKRRYTLQIRGKTEDYYEKYKTLLLTVKSNRYGIISSRQVSLTGIPKPKPGQTTGTNPVKIQIRLGSGHYYDH